MAEKIARIKRVRDVLAGTFNFTYLPTGAVLSCDMADLFPEFPREAVRLDDYEGDSFESMWAGLPIIVRHLTLWGVNAKVGDKGAATDSDPEDMGTAWANLKAGSWSTGGGGGGSLTTYQVELRAHVARELVKAGWGRTDADKEARKDDNPASAFMHVAVAAATQIGNDVTAQDVFSIQFPKIEAAAKKEADRRDKAESKGVVDLSDSVREAIMAAATARTEESAA